MTVAAPEKLKFRLRAGVAIEDFGERSLVLLCDSLELRVINAAARRMLALLDGERTVQDIALRLAPDGAGLAAVAAALLEMEGQGIVRREAKWKPERSDKMGEAKYLANPEVSFRQEDDDGGILFHLEGDAVEAINPTAVAIWKFLSAPRTEAEVAAHVCAAFAGAPPDQVARDVAEFLGSFLKKGFIGEVEEPAP